MGEKFMNGRREVTERERPQENKLKRAYLCNEEKR